MQQLDGKTPQGPLADKWDRHRVEIADPRASVQDAVLFDSSLLTGKTRKRSVSFKVFTRALSASLV